MDTKKARTALDGKPNKISTEQIEKDLAIKGQAFVYLDRDNQAKDVKKICDFFSQKGYNVHQHEIHYGLDDTDYLYEMHIISPTFVP